MPIRKERLYRYYSPLLATTTEKRIESSHYVEGYATTFAPYLLFERDGVQFFEHIAPDALNDADMSDVIFQYDHSGMVFARQSNGTLGIEADDRGLFVYADLSKTEDARRMHEAIGAGLITKMSWAFTIAEETYNRDTRTWTISKIKKVYDVSAVSIPANGDTEITARDLERRSYALRQSERLGLEAKLLALKIKLEV
ncbi:MAG: HK97 family phage prohead protease [Defluviitaleaceae bacterium]|nr:HK97 family phage prohead protease [Defluviitaleaceae bacterium]